MSRTPQTMTVTEFKSGCSRILGKLGPEGVVLTRRGRTVALVTPAGRMTGRGLIGALKGEVVVRGRSARTSFRH